MIRPLVIGYGNSLRQDDGVGWRAADLLAERLNGIEAEILCCRQLTPELVAKLETQRMAIFLDASIDRPFQSVTLTSIRPKPQSDGFSHHLTPERLMGLAQAVYGHAPPGFVVTAGLKDFALSERLTENGEACAARMADLSFQIIVGLCHVRESG